MVSMSTDQSKFFFIANNLAIDFMNTDIVDRGQAIDLLDAPSSLVNWASSAGIGLQDKVTTANMSLAKELRGAIKTLVASKLDGNKTPDTSLNTVNAWLPKGSIEQHLKEEKGNFTLTPLHEKLTVEMLLGRIATDAAVLLSSFNHVKLKRCANSKCVLMFVDISRSGKRRWCSMDVCGNRAKAANHYLNIKA